MPIPDVNRAVGESEIQSLQIHHHVIALHRHRQRLRHIRPLHHARSKLDIDRIGARTKSFGIAIPASPM